jgi:hypothetical protein
MANEIYHKMAAALNSKFVEEEPLPKSKTALPAVTMPTDVALVEEKETVFEEQDFIKDEIHNTIDMLNDVMDILKSDLRQGSKYTGFDVFGNLAKAKISAISELGLYDKSIKAEERYEASENNEKTVTEQNITINMNGADMLDKILEYRNKQIMNSEVINTEVINEDEDVR